MLTEEEWEAIVEKRQKERKARMEAQVGRAKAKVKAVGTLRRDNDGVCKPSHTAKHTTLLST